MRQLTVGGSESPHVTHPFTSNCEMLYLDILCLLTCFFIGLGPGGKPCTLADSEAGEVFQIWAG